MTTDSIKAIAAVVAAGYPDAPIHVDDIEAGAEGSFYIHIVNMSSSGGIGGRRSGNVQYDLIYFSEQDDALKFAEWSDNIAELLRQFEHGGRIYRAFGCTAHREDMEFHYIFSLQEHYSVHQQGEIMQTLEVNIESD